MQSVQCDRLTSVYLAQRVPQWGNEQLRHLTQLPLFWVKTPKIHVSVLRFFQVSALDWVQAEKTYHLCEVLFKVHKVSLSILCTPHVSMLTTGPLRLKREREIYRCRKSNDMRIQALPPPLIKIPQKDVVESLSSLFYVGSALFHSGLFIFTTCLYGFPYT